MEERPRLSAAKVEPGHCAPISRERSQNAQSICDLALVSRWASSSRLGGRGGRVNACCDRSPARRAFVGGWKAQGRDEHSDGARRSNRPWICVLRSQEQWCFGARWTMNALSLAPIKKFSSPLQETNAFETPDHWALVQPGPMIRCLKSVRFLRILKETHLSQEPIKGSMERDA